MSDYERFRCLYDVEKAFEWDKWRMEIPYLSFDPLWEVRAVPPFSTGIVRYNIRHKNIPESFVSIYLDCYDRAGYMDMKPYWEVYPHNGDCYRCYMRETDALLKAIHESFEGQRNEKTQTQKA